MRKRPHHSARLLARPSRQQELPFATNVLPVLKDAFILMAHRPALEHLLAALLESSEEALVSVSPEGLIEMWSAGAERLYGYTAREMIGEPLKRLLPLYELVQTGLPLAPGSRVDPNSIELASGSTKTVREFLSPFGATLYEARTAKQREFSSCRRRWPHMRQHGLPRKHRCTCSCNRSLAFSGLRTGT